MTLKNYPIVTAVVSTVSLMLQLTRWLTHHNESSRTYWLHTTLAVLQLSQGIANFVIFFYSIHRNRDRRSQVDTVKRVHLFTPVNADDSTASGSSQPALENSGRRSEMDNSMRGDDLNDDPAYIVDAVISSLCWPCIKWGFFSSPSGHSRDSVALQGSAWRYRPVVDVSATAGEDSEQCVSFVFDNSFGFGSSSTGIGEGLLSAHQKPPSVDSTGARSVSRESA